MIAIVGMACTYADANSPLELWENTISKRISFRKIPKKRLNIEDYSINNQDSIYIKDAALIEGYEFDRNKFKISGKTYRSTDLTHWLALDVAQRSLIDSGLLDGNLLDKENTAVIVGNTLTGEFSRASLMRLRWPYVKNTLYKELSKNNWEESSIKAFLESFENNYKLPFEPPGEESLAGGLSNTIAGRICNYFNFNGGGYTVDGACSSSLLAVYNACSMLENGDSKVVLVGGVDISLDPFELIGFSRINAMAHKDMRVYDKNPTGFLPGEGCGFMVLMNYEDALSKGLRVYSLIKGWGISSDGAGGITRPEKNGQKLAIKRAYEKAKYKIDTVSFFEGHGTGTPVGDEVELSALSDLLSGDNHIPVISSIKPNIGHTKAAAGLAGMIKSIMAINNQMLPPITNTSNPNKIFENNKLRILDKAEIWPSNQPLRAGISSFGFGGINVHVSIEGVNNTRRIKKTTHEKKLTETYQQCELFLISGNNKQEICELIEKLIIQSTQISQAEMTDLSFFILKENKNKEIRAGIVADSPQDLFNKLNSLLKTINDGSSFVFDKSGIFLNNKKQRLGYLFPGQASPVRFDAGSFSKFDKISKLYKENCLGFNNKIDTSHAQPCIVMAEMSGLFLLEELGVEADVSLGHSLGELVALYWGGSINQEDLIELVKKRGQIMAEATTEGSMVAVYADRKTVERLSKETQVYISAYNNSEQTIVSGSNDNIGNFILKASEEKINCVKLPVSKPFHSILMKESAAKWQSFIDNYIFRECKKNVISSVTGSVVGNDLKQNITKQFTEPVLFSNAFDLFLNKCDYFIEVGPGEILTNICNKEKSLSLDCCSPSIKSFLTCIASIYAVGGQNLNLDILSSRFYKNYKFNKSFFSNQCEEYSTDAQIDFKKIESSEPSSEQSVLDTFKLILANKVELAPDEINEDQNLLKDLHMNSINVGQAVVELSKKIGLKVPISPMEFANSTVGEISSLLERKLKESPKIEPKDFVKGVSDWVRCFNVDLVEVKQEKQNYIDQDEISSWKLFFNNNNLAIKIFDKIKQQKTKGVLLCLDENSESIDCLNLLVECSKYCIENKIKKVVLVQHNGFAFSFLKSLNEELKADLILLDTPYEESFIENIVSECYTNKNLVECFYDEKGRKEKVLKLVEKNKTIDESLFDSTILVSGGGKGITFECIYNLSKKYNNKLIILGRKKPEVDKVLSDNLLRLKEAKIEYRYFSVDINDENLIKDILESQKELGEISCFIHGAGVNEPCLIGNLTIEKIEKTLSPKVFGLKSILKVLGKQLKLVVNFSSIIGRLGMEGQADYAYANSWVSWISNRMNKNCRCVSMEWSVWSGVGMGESLGKIDELKKKGISPITPEEGVKCFIELVENKNINNNIFICGRLGENCPLNIYPKEDMPILRFLENIKIIYPGIELICDSNLSVNKDLYLKDHIYKGEIIFPVVMGIEAIIQSSQALKNTNKIPIIKNLKLNRPIVIQENEDLILRVASLINNYNEINVAIRCSQTNFQVDHFYAVVSFEDNKHTPQIEIEEFDKIKLDNSFYGKLFFQEGRFQCAESYNYIDSQSCIFNLINKDNNWYSSFLPQINISGNPGIRDSAIHSIQACIPNNIVLPVSVSEWASIEKLDSDGYKIKAKQVWEKNDEYCFDLEIFDKNDKLREYWKGLVLKEIDKLKWSEINANLLSAYIDRESKKILNNNDFNVKVFDEKSKFKNKIQYRTDGKPIMVDGFVSISNSKNLYMTIDSKFFEVGCDLELIEERSEDIWRGLLGDNYYLIELIKTNESISEKSTRVWCSMESMKKMGLKIENSLNFINKQDNCLLLGSKDFLVYSNIIKVKDHGKYCFSIGIKNESI